MKHFIIAIIAVLSVLAREQLLTSAKGCPRRYLRRINGKCYYFSVKKLNWFGALNNCLRKGLTLADLSNPRDFNGAIDFLSSKGNTEDFWFGANDLQTEGRFQYISNGRLVRYFSNFSIVEPAEHSECDDCLEVRIRNNMSVVADDNCLERQYFICSERYCESGGSNKPRHHSHEHLHHFHHDIGEPSDEVVDEDQTPSPFDSAPQEGEQNESEEAGGPEQEGVATDVGRQAGEEAVTPAEGAVTPAEGEETTAEGAVTPAEGAVTPAEGAVTPAEGEEATAEGAATPAEGAVTPAEGAATPAEEAVTPAEGAETTAEAAAAQAEAGESTPAVGESPSEGEEKNGEATPAAQGDGTQID